MTAFIIRRLLLALPILFLLSLATFTLLRVMPGDDVICPGFCTPEQREALRHDHGLDKPLFPVSADPSVQDLWLLAVPAVAAAGVLAARSRRRRVARLATPAR